jgi:spermidine synthase
MVMKVKFHCLRKETKRTTRSKLSKPTLTILNRLLSWVWPVQVAQGRGTTTPLLRLYYYQGCWQLAAQQALYSYGRRYPPIKVGYKLLGSQLIRINQVLVLGAGLGSAIDVYRQFKTNNNVCFTLIDIDTQVIEWGSSIHSNPNDGLTNQWILSDAVSFLNTNKSSFDLIIVDIFEDIVVPSFVLNISFWKLLRNQVHNNNPKVIFNYIEHIPLVTQKLKKDWEASGWSIAESRKIGTNIIFILEVSGFEEKL